MSNEEETKKRQKRPASHPFKMLATFADSKGQQVSRPELGYVQASPGYVMATDSYRMLYIGTSERHFVDEPQLVPLTFFSKLKENTVLDTIDTIREMMEASEYEVPDHDGLLCRYPDFPSAVSEVSTFRTHRTRFLDRLELVGKVSAKADPTIHLDVSEGVLKLRAQAGEIAMKAELAIECRETDFRPFSTRVNYAYLKDALDTLPDDHVTVSLIEDEQMYAFYITGEAGSDIAILVALAKDEAPTPEE